MSDPASFLRSLTESGRVRVPIRSEIGFEAGPDTEAALREIDATLRLDAPGIAPALDVSAAIGGARVLFDACRFLVDRAVEGAQIEPALRLDPGPAPSAEVCWSTDLTLRYLPDLHVQARSRAHDDPLLACLIRLGRDWPLSGVGMPIDGERTLPDALRDDACLRGLLVDRVIARKDLALARIPWIAGSIAAVRGAYPALVPQAEGEHGPTHG